jgi:hypothetical protein
MICVPRHEGERQRTDIEPDRLLDDFGREAVAAIGNIQALARRGFLLWRLSNAGRFRAWKHSSAFASAERSVDEMAFTSLTSNVVLSKGHLAKPIC